MNSKILFLAITIVIANTLHAQVAGDPKLTEVWNPVPKKVSPGKGSTTAPSDAIILFDGKDAAAWQMKTGKPFAWKVEDNTMTVVPSAGDVQTKQGFGDCQLHIEWRIPATVTGEGQARGNSGIFLMGRYELQVLDSYGSTTYTNGQAGSIYKQLIPLVNASRPAGEWQLYDVIFTAPQFYEDSTIKSAARITVFHNGVLVQNNRELWGSTEYIGIPKYTKHSNKEPIILQDHGNAISFRNIWIRPL